jgi:hydrogenase maturation protease
MQTKWLLVGVGNDYRSDDGIGLIVARKIRENNIPNVIIKEESGEGAALMEAWQGFENVILVDAVSSGANAGATIRIEADKEKIPARFFTHSSHSFGVAEAVEMARVLDSLPKRIIIYGIEGLNYKSGTTPSIALLKTSEKVVENILAEIDR